MTTPLPSLRPDCSRCAALCCVTLPFTRSADFPESKPAGQPCHHLTTDLRCGIHSELRERGWRGCTVFECYGAGQRVTARIGQVRGLENDAALAGRLTDAFPVVHHLHEMLWYLTDPAVATTRHAAQAERLAHEIDQEIDEAGARGAAALAAVDVQATRTRVAMLLRAVSDDARGRASGEGRAAVRLPRAVRPGGDLAGARLRGADLRAAPLRGAFLVAADLRDADLRGADLLGADLRDADLRGARLEGALFLTRPQLTAARGDGRTTVPERLSTPPHWT